MVKLEDIKQQMMLTGIAGQNPVAVISVSPFGPDCIKVVYRTEFGSFGEQMLFRKDEVALTAITVRGRWTFDADPQTVRLASEAVRISLAYLFDPYLAVHTSAIEPLPHQITAVYQEMLPRLPLRFILADDPGAGKTIMTGLYIKELLARSALQRCLIVTPGNLCEQWQDELYQKFGLKFELMTNDLLANSPTGNPFNEHNFLIARLDKLARNEDLQARIKAAQTWDLIVCDEAHKLSATLVGNRFHYTHRFRLGLLLGSRTRDLLLLTATPHNGKEPDFQMFLSLVDPVRFEGAEHAPLNRHVDASHVMRRLVKEELVKFDGTPLFPERRAFTVNFTLTPYERELYEAVTHYVQEEFNRADRLNDDMRRTSIGFALTSLQRRLASSPEAIYQSLHRRRSRLEASREELKNDCRRWKAEQPRENMGDEDGDLDDLSDSEAEETENRIVSLASASETLAELNAEIATLQKLEASAAELRASGTDHKWDELSRLLTTNGSIRPANGQSEKLIIFTEHRDTLNYLVARIGALLGDPASVVSIHGGLSHDRRKEVEALFKQDVNVKILVATDAAGEGINLQRAHLMINYDIPWNPNRLEQRFGRIHRIGQTEVCTLWNLVASETREGAVFNRLFEKLNQEREALGGKVFDILGRMTFNNRPLRDLLIEAIRHGNSPDVRRRMSTIVDKTFDPGVIKQLLAERALSTDTLDSRTVVEVRKEMERAAARKLQPYFIGSFFVEAFRRIGGVINEREEGRYEIVSVPPDVIRIGEHLAAVKGAVLKRYERVTFEREKCDAPGLPVADLLCPGHPLLDAVTDLIKARYSSQLRQGAVLVDDADPGSTPRLLFYVRDTLVDGHIVDSVSQRRRVVSQSLRFVEMKPDGTACDAGYAPYLDYRAANPAEIRAALQNSGIQQNADEIENNVRVYATNHILQPHLEQETAFRSAEAERSSKQVKDRLQAELRYWDNLSLLAHDRARNSVTPPPT